MYVGIGTVGEGKTGIANFKNYLGNNEATVVRTYLADVLQAASSSRNATFEKCIEDTASQVMQQMADLYKQQTSHVEDRILVYQIVAAVELLSLIMLLQFGPLMIRPLLKDLYLKFFPVKLDENLGLNAAKIEELGIAEELIPNEYRCLISTEIMDEPVRTCDSIPGSTDPYFDKHPSYEKSQINNWLKLHDYPPHNPSRILANKFLTPDTVLKTKINDFIRAQESLFSNKHKAQQVEPNNSLRARLK